MASTDSLIELLNIIYCASSDNNQSISQLSASVPELLSGNTYAFEQNAKPILISLISPYGKIHFVVSFQVNK